MAAIISPVTAGAGDDKKLNMSKFTKKYPHLTWWVENQGYIEIGEDDYSTSWLRLLDPGGLCWEDDDSETIDEALNAAEDFLKEELPSRFGATLFPEKSGKALLRVNAVKGNFKSQMKGWNKDFEAYLTQKFSARTANKHAATIDLLIDYLTFDKDVKSFAQITKGMINSNFVSWYRYKVADLDSAEVKVGVKKFLTFLEEEKGIDTSHLVAK